MYKLFKEEDVDVVLSADETLLHFYEYTKRFLVPIGVKILYYPGLLDDHNPTDP